MPIVLNGTTGITTPTYNGSTTAEYLVPVTGFKNRIINGDMTIDQRNAGAEVNPAVNATYYLDRWVVGQLVSGKFKIGQNAGAVTPPAGFTNYLGCTSISSYSVGAGDYLGVIQKIEGFNTADLGWGTANASTVTLSFWVRSSLTGTFSGSILNSASSRSYIFSYSIPSANTWTYVSATIPGDTSGTWLTTNGTGIEVYFNLGSGSGYNAPAGFWNGLGYRGVTGGVSVVGTNNATWYVTGVQLEKGSVATSFDYLPYGTELALCQRYTYRFLGTGVQTSLVGSGGFFTPNQVELTVYFPVTMRATPSTTVANGTNYWRNVTNGTTTSFSDLLASLENRTCALLYSGGGATLGTQGYTSRVDVQNSSAGILFSAEL
jgi:hypothetical protein